MVHITGPFEIVPGVPPKRHVRIYVPRRSRQYERPLLLMFDGQNVFDDAPSFAGGWHAHERVERLAKTVVPPVVVGIDHGHEHRIAELSPFDFGQVQGALDPFLAWLAGWLLPKLRGELQLTSDPRRTIVAGSSMGGLAALYAALRRPDVFGGAIAMSPSVWVARGKMLEWAPRNVPSTGTRLYIDAGAKEGRMLPAAERLAQSLASTGRVDLKFYADPRGQHREKDWRRRLLPALRFHFGSSRKSRA